ncbi:MAG: hypothetical protein IJ529_06410 [Alphaproteobacteria bacterium]|nr:hypothetical protein [Alphaproteobacteria bacterium]MBQ9235556.1 hypothetical protein [Alphaproteobacteria bacterium]
MRKINQLAAIAAVLSVFVGYGSSKAAITLINNTRYAVQAAASDNTQDELDLSELATPVPLSGPYYAGAASSPYDCALNYGYVNCDNSPVDCVYSSTGSTSMGANSFTCACNQMSAPEDIELCDGDVFPYHSSFNFLGYARAKGYAVVGGTQMAPGFVAGSDNWFYPQIPVYYCPIMLNNSSPASFYYALTTNYYSKAFPSMHCAVSSTGLEIVGGTNGINCIRPGQGTPAKETYITACVYDAQGVSQQEYEDKLSYLSSCSSAPSLWDSGIYTGSAHTTSRTYSALSAHNEDLCAGTSYDEKGCADYLLSRYYNYMPHYLRNYSNPYLAVEECAINCSSSSLPYNDPSVPEGNEIRPYCQGFHFIYDCDYLRDRYEGYDNVYYYISPLQTTYAAADSNALLGVEKCYDNSVYATRYFAVCGNKASVTSETVCLADNATCSGATGEYTCAGDKYCSACICQSDYVTLAQWCATNGITTDCDYDHYAGVADDGSCSADNDANGPKFKTYALITTDSDGEAANVCPPESQTVALENYNGITAAYLKGKYGSGVEISQCNYLGTDDTAATIKWLITCDSDVYQNVCSPSSNAATSWCVYGRNSSVTMRYEANNNAPLKHCKAASQSGICGQSVYTIDYTGAEVMRTPSDSFKIYTVDTPNACYSTYGKAASVQLCLPAAGSSAAQSNHPSYNCFYDLDEFKYATTSKNGAIACAVRHDLSGDYVLYKGQKRWAECACPQAYSHHYYNCSGGILAGGACKQDLSNVNSSPYLKSKWLSENLPTDAAGDITITSIDLYPYCSCDPSYNKSCTGERETGDGEACNGKYQSCICTPDPLPEHWADSYFGCPDGYEPTGVWRDDGCGQKIYECSDAISCTAEYQYTCDAVGQTGYAAEGCQDSNGDFVRFTACHCKSEYNRTCSGANQSGVGDSDDDYCQLEEDGTKYYKDCTCPSEYVTCSSPATGDTAGGSCIYDSIDSTLSGHTVWEYCSCPDSYEQCGDEGQIPDPNATSCKTSSGITLYSQCSCPAAYKACTTGNRIGYVGDNYLKCLIPSGSSLIGTQDVDSVAYTAGMTIYQRCTCPATYTVCSDHNAVGSGASCLSEIDSKTYWQYCNCETEYNNTCAAPGMLPVSEDDYCQISESDAKYYTQCKCGATGYQRCGHNSVGQGIPCDPADTDFLGDDTHPEASTAPASVQPTLDPQWWPLCSCDTSVYTSLCNSDAETPAPVTSYADYCVTSSGETYYKSCSCKANYNLTCEDETDPSDATSYIYKNVVGSGLSCSTEVTTPAAASGASATTTPVTYYSSCKCQDEYTQDCASKGPAYVPDDVNDYCQNGLNTTKLYKQCVQAAGYTKLCNASGQVGLDYQTVKNNSSSPISIITDQYGTTQILYPNQSASIYLGHFSTPGGINYYKACGCEASFSYSCDNSQTDEDGNLLYHNAIGDSSSGSCNTSPAFSFFDASGNDISASLSTDPASAFFKKCKCNNASYVTPCSHTGTYTVLNPPADADSNYCLLGDQKKLYQNCSCPPNFQTCTGNGQSPSGDGVCFSGGSWINEQSPNTSSMGGSTLYSACVCSSSFSDCSYFDNTIGDSSSPVCTSIETDYTQDSSGSYVANISSTKTFFSTCKCDPNLSPNGKWYTQSSTVAAFENYYQEVSSTYNLTGLTCVDRRNSASNNLSSSIACSGYKCDPPARGLGTPINCPLDNEDYYPNGCECPPWFRSSCSGLGATDTAHSSKGIWGGNHGNNYSANPYWSTCTKQTAKVVYSLICTTGNGSTCRYNDGSGEKSLDAQQVNVILNDDNIDYQSNNETLCYLTDSNNCTAPNTSTTDLRYRDGMPDMSDYSYNSGNCADSGTGTTAYVMFKSGGRYFLNDGELKIFYRDGSCTPTASTNVPKVRYVPAWERITSSMNSDTSTPWILSSRVYKSDGHYYPSCTPQGEGVNKHPSQTEGALPQCMFTADWISHNAWSMSDDDKADCYGDQYVKAHWNHLEWSIDGSGITNMEWEYD